MYFEILLVGVLLFIILTANGFISPNKFIQDNQDIFMKLKESDYDFLVKAKYGDGLYPDVLFQKRIKSGLIVILCLIFIMLQGLSLVKVAVSFIGGYVIFKLDYSSLKSYYKSHLQKIDSMLPYYLKGLEILIQHYTVPVALAKSIDDAPDIFKPGLREMIAKIDAGDSSIQPYMDFANEYPVRDSMRMMRLLYRLGLGSQEEKHEQIMMFSRTVSSLQNKAREQKYKDRLESMEKRTMMMLFVTGGGVLLVLFLSMTIMMGI